MILRCTKEIHWGTNYQIGSTFTKDVVYHFEPFRGEMIITLNNHGEDHAFSINEFATTYYGQWFEEVSE